MANLGNTIINGILRVNGKINVGESITAPSFIGTLTGEATGSIKSLSISGKTITYTKGDDTTGTIVTQDKEVKVNATAPDSETGYYPIWFTATSGTGEMNANDGFKYNTKQGSASVVGVAKLILGNTSPSGTVGNKAGQIQLASSNTGYAIIKQNEATGQIDHYFPATSGTLLNTGTTSFTQTQTGGTELGTIKINGTSTKIYAPTSVSSAATLTTPRTINGVSFDGSANITITANPTNNALTNEDLNDLKGDNSYVGIYSAGGSNTVTNKPAGIDAFGLKVFKTAGGWWTQELISGNMLQETRWTRQWGDNSWSSWTEMKYTDKNVKINTTNPAAATNYYPVWYTGTSGTGELNANDGFSYNVSQGTTSEIGSAKIVAGNPTASGTAGNKRGMVLLYSPSTGFGQIQQQSTSTNLYHELPATGGTLLNSGTTSFTQTLTSGTELGTIKINNTNTKIYAPTYIAGQGIIIDNYTIKKKPYISGVAGIDGTQGYIKIAKIEITSGYQNAPIEFTIGRRNDTTPTRISIKFNSQATAATTTLATFVAIGSSREFWMALEDSEIRTYALYAKKTEAYDNIGILNYYKPSFDVGLNVILTDILVNSLPTENITQASWGGTVATASTATKATQDGDGNTISSTYLKKSGGTMTGDLTVNTTTTTNKLTIGNGVSDTADIAFSRGDYNIISAPSGGLIGFISNGKSITSQNADLVIDNNIVRAGNNNTVSLGTNSFKWNNVYATTFTGALSGNASTATALQNSRTISLTGDVTGSTSFDGSADASITTTVADDSHNHTATTLPVVTNINKTIKTATNTTTGWFTIAKTPVNNEFWSCRLLVEVKASTTQWQTFELDLIGYGISSPTLRLMQRYDGTAMITQFRAGYPKAINNGYGAFIDIYSNVTTSKNIKVTLLQSENVELTDIAASIYNSTYHNVATVNSNTNGMSAINSYNQGSTDQAAIAQSLRNDQYFQAGEAIATNDIVALATDGKYYKVTNTTVSFDARTCLSGRSENAYAADTAAYVRQLYSFAPLAAYTTENEGMIANKSVYVEGTLTNTGEFTSNGKVTSVLTNGHSYMRIGVARSTTVLFMDKNVYCFTLDEDGFLTNYNGFAIGAVRAIDSGETCNLDIE